MIKLKSRVGNNLENDEDDIFQVKNVFSRLGLFNFSVKPEPHGYITRPLQIAIKKFQKENSLSVDGKMFPDGETEKHLNKYYAKRISEDNDKLPAVPPPKVEREQLPAQKKLIPGTNIPDEGIPEQGFSKPRSGEYGNRKDHPVYKMDEGILLKNIPNRNIDPHMELIPEEYPSNIGRRKKRKYDI